jgi:hypothetical protein
VRRAAIGAFLVVGFLFVGTGTASAHSCAKPVTISSDKKTEIQVGVTMAEAPIAITLQFAPEVVVTKPGKVPGLRIEPQGQQVQYEGDFHADQCILLPVEVRGTAAGTYRVRALQAMPDGTETEHPADGDIFIQPDGSSLQVNHEGPPNPAFEQVVYVKASGTSGSSAPIFLLLGTFVVTVLAVVLLTRRPRRPRKPTAEPPPAEVSTGS